MRNKRQIQKVKCPGCNEMRQKDHFSQGKCFTCGYRQLKLNQQKKQTAEAPKKTPKKIADPDSIQYQENTQKAIRTDYSGTRKEAAALRPHYAEVSRMQRKQSRVSRMEEDQFERPRQRQNYERKYDKFERDQFFQNEDRKGDRVDRLQRAQKYDKADKVKGYVPLQNRLQAVRKERGSIREEMSSKKYDRPSYQEVEKRQTRDEERRNRTNYDQEQHPVYKNQKLTRNYGEAQPAKCEWDKQAYERRGKDGDLSTRKRDSQLDKPWRESKGFDLKPKLASEHGYKRKYQNSTEPKPAAVKLDKYEPALKDPHRYDSKLQRYDSSKYKYQTKYESKYQTKRDNSYSKTPSVYASPDRGPLARVRSYRNSITGNSSVSKEKSQSNYQPGSKYYQKGQYQPQKTKYEPQGNYLQVIRKELEQMKRQLREVNTRENMRVFKFCKMCGREGQWVGGVCKECK